MLHASRLPLPWTMRHQCDQPGHSQDLSRYSKQSDPILPRLVSCGVASGAFGSMSGAILSLGGGLTRPHLATLSLARCTSQVFEET